MSEIHDYYKGFEKSFIETATGGRFYAEKPEFKIEDIGFALAKLCRFNGHSQIFYSVAQHSLLVAEIMECDRVRGMADGEPLEGLLHDATEAYLSDVPAPLKQFLPDFKKLDAEWERQLRGYFGLPPEKSAACQRADWIALFLEADVHMLSRGTTFVDPHGYRDVALRDYGALRSHVFEQGWRDVAWQFVMTARRYDDARRKA